MARADSKRTRCPFSGARRPISAMQYVSRRPNFARAVRRSTSEMGADCGRPLGTKATGAMRTQSRSRRSSARETAATPRVKFPRMRATNSYRRTAAVARVSPWNVATTGTRASRPATSATNSALKSCA
ncbi:MAG: hypothetical protein AUI48_13870 [Chloroflexi bacterium 13_1_40CM_2_68_14]|nr:MAG: hypothetical protein AUI48_13870 [Chloroflexi bacterium 13_1_40CM_2_68_14]